MSDIQTDAQAIADSVALLDPHDQVGAYNGIVDADFHPEKVEANTGNPFKQTICDGAKKLEPYTAAADKVAVLKGAVDISTKRALAEGRDWQQADFSDFKSQIETTFIDEDSSLVEEL